MSSSSQSKDRKPEGSLESKDVRVSSSSSGGSGVHPVLTNSVVLSNIFGYMSLKELKEMRTICRAWEGAANSILGKSTVLDVKAVCDDYYDGIGGGLLACGPNIKSQLVRRIKIQNLSSKSDGLLSTSARDVDKSELDQSLCLIFLQAHREFIQEIVYSVDWTNYGRTPSMTVLFQDVVCPKLSKVTIVETNTCSSTWRTKRIPRDAKHLQNIVTLTKIKELEFDASVGERDGRLRNWRYPHLATFQELINKSPKLERLKITGNVYPDLRSASNLKALEFTGFPLISLPNDNDDEDSYRLGIREEFSMELLLKMLRQVKNGLVELILSATVIKSYDGEEFNSLELNDNYHNDETGFIQLPSFPKLKSLVINSTNGFVFKISLLQNNFPALTKLTLFSKPADIDAELGAIKILGIWSTVKELSFNVFHWTSEPAIRSLQNMATFFPNVKKLDIVWSGPLIFDYRYGEDVFIAWLKELGKCWLLDALTLRLECEKLSLTQLMEAVGGASFTGLKTLRLVATDNVEDDGCRNFHGALRAIPKLSFQGFIFKGSTILRMMDFFEASDKDRLQFID